MSTASVISKLTNLQSLYLERKPDINVRAQDLQGLKELKDISANFCDIKEFNAYVRSFFGRDRVLQNYCFTVMKTASFELNSPKSVAFGGLDLGNGAMVLPEDIKELFIYECHQCSRCLCHCLSFRINNNPCKIEYFEIITCDKLENLCCFSLNCAFCSSIQLVDCLTLEGLEDLQNIVEPTLAPPLHLTTLFSHLTHLKVFKCHNMKTLLTPELSAQLQSLETIEVENCESMKEIVLDGSRQKDHIISLPNLSFMKLINLPELNFISREIMLCLSLKYLEIEDCEKLKWPPKIYPPLQIKKTPWGFILKKID